MTWQAILIVVISILGGPVIAYYVAQRRMKGTVDTSTAGELWRESASIRDDYRARLGDYADRQRDLEARVARLEGQNNQLLQENFQLKNILQEQTTKIIGLEALVEELRRTITKLEGTIADQTRIIDQQKGTS